MEYFKVLIFLMVPTILFGNGDEYLLRKEYKHVSKTYQRESSEVRYSCSIAEYLPGDLKTKTENHVTVGGYCNEVETTGKRIPEGQFSECWAEKFDRCDEDDNCNDKTTYCTITYVYVNSKTGDIENDVDTCNYIKAKDAAKVCPLIIEPVFETEDSYEEKIIGVTTDIEECHKARVVHTSHFKAGQYCEKPGIARGQY